MNKQTLLIIPGALGHKIQFDSLVVMLSAQFNCIVLELPMHGQNKDDITFDIPTLAQYVNDYLTKYQLERVKVFGYSLGGYVALYTSYLNPKAFTSIITYATKFDWNKQQTDNQLSNLNPSILIEKVPYFVKQLEANHPHIHWEKLLQHTSRLIQDIHEKNYLNEHAFAFISKNSQTTSIHISVGADDKFVTKLESQAVAEQLEGHYHEVMNSAHLWEKTNIDAIANLITSTS